MTRYHSIAFSQALGVCLIILVTQSAFAEDAGREWFARMSQAVEQLNYRGTFVHMQNHQLHSMEILHKVDNDQVYERVTSRSGPIREFIRDGEKVQCIVDARKEVVVDTWQDQNPLRSSLPVYQESLSEHYRFRYLAGDQKVAGRDTVFIGIEPKDNYRYGYRLWLDQETAMPLICELVDQHGRLIDTMHFTSIEFDPDFAANDFKATLNTENFDRIEPLNKRRDTEHSNSRWQAGDIPNGFTLSVSKVEENGDVRVEHHVYTDGLASVSVFAEPRSHAEENLTGARKIGVISAFGRVEGDFQITVIGEVPTDTVKKIGNSFQQRP